MKTTVKYFILTQFGEIEVSKSVYYKKCNALKCKERRSYISDTEFRTKE